MFWETYCVLCAKAQSSPNRVAKELSISSGAVTEWKKGRSPQSSTLQKIADYFGVTVDYLLGKEEKPTVNDDGLSDGQRKLMAFAQSVPEDKIDLILKVMQSIVEAP